MDILDLATSVDVGWTLVAAALVFFMQAGFAMVETGFTRAKNAGNIIMKNLMDFCIGTVVFIVIGFGLFLGEDLGLANREYEVLLYLAEHPDRDITFEELGNALLGTYMEADRRLVMVNVSRLRKKLDCSHELSNHIETVWGKGYRFIIASYRQ